MHEAAFSRLNWDDCRLFLAVARAGQILAAARTLGLNQATLSRRIAGLEQDLGAKLLMRRPHGSELTDAGLALVEALERMEGELLASQARLQGADAVVSGVVRIGAPDGFGVGFLAARLPRLSARHPDLTLQLVPTPRGFSLSRREADIAVMVGRPDKGRLVARRLTEYTLGLYASRTYAGEHGLPESLAALSEHRLVGYVEDLVAAPALSYAQEFLRSWRSSVEISSAIGQFAAVRAGAGIGVLHDYLAAEVEDLLPVLPNVRAKRSYWIAMHENLRDVGRVRAVADFLAEIVREADFVVAGDAPAKAENAVVDGE